MDPAKSGAVPGITAAAENTANTRGLNPRPARRATATSESARERRTATASGCACEARAMKLCGGSGSPRAGPRRIADPRSHRQRNALGTFRSCARRKNSCANVVSQARPPAGNSSGALRWQKWRRRRLRRHQAASRPRQEPGALRSTPTTSRASFTRRRSPMTTSSRTAVSKARRTRRRCGRKARSTS